MSVVKYLRYTIPWTHFTISLTTPVQTLLKLVLLVSLFI